MFGQQRASERQRILSGGVRHLVHETLDEEAVLVDVHAAPEPRLDVRVAHRVIDQQIGHAEADGMLTFGRDPLERERVHAVLEQVGEHVGNDRLARQPHVHAGQIVVRIEARGHLALHHRVIAAVRHVFFTAPQELHRYAGHLLGDEHRLTHVVVKRPAPAEAATKVHLVDLDPIGRQTGGVDRHRERGLAVLRRPPAFALLRRPARGEVHRLHRRVVLIRIVVDRLDLLGSAGERGFDIAVLHADERFGRIETGLQDCVDRRARHLGARALVPNHRQCIDRGLGVPPGIRNDRDARIAHLHDLFDTWHARDLGGVEALDLAALHRAIADRRVQHAGQLQIGAVHLFAGELVVGVEPLDRLADELPVLRILEWHVFRRFQLRRGFGHFAVGGLAPARVVRDDAVRHRAFGHRYFPLVRRRLHQHHSRRRAAFAHVFVRHADAAAATGGKVAPDALARDALPRRRVLGGHLRPIALQLLGHHLRQTGEGALPHLGAGDADHHGVVWTDHHPRIDLGRTIVGAHHFRPEWQAQTKREPTAYRHRRREERAAIHIQFDRHGCPFTHWPRHGSPCAPLGRCRSDRCW